MIKLYLLRAALIFTVVFSWEILAAGHYIDPFYVSQPSRILNDLIAFYSSGDMVKHLRITLKAALWGLAIGGFIGVAFGFLLGRIKLLADVIEPIVTALYGIPKLALAPIFILWFGVGIESKIFLSGLLVFYLVFFSTFSGVRSVDPQLIGAVRLLGANRVQIMLKVIFPSSVPWILAGVRGGIGASLIGAIVGEYMGASAGIGWMIMYATSFFQTDRVMSCIFLLLLIGLTLNILLKNAEQYLLRWRPKLDFSTN